MLRHLPLLSLPLAGAALIVALSGPSKTEETPSAPEIEPASRDEVAALKSRLKNIEADADLLRARIRALETRTPTSGQPAPAETHAAIPPASGAPTKETVRGLLTGEGTVEARAEIKQVVKSVQEELREEQRRERVERRREIEERTQQERQQRWRQFATNQRLDYRQEQALNERLEAERTRQAQLFEELRDGRRTPREMRQETNAMRTATDREMKSLLGEEQYKAYIDERRTEQRRRGGGERRPTDGLRPNGERARQR